MGTNMGNKNSTTLERADPATIESFEECVFAFHGNLGGGKTHAEIQKMIEEGGGKFEDCDSRVENCTHLITTEKYVKKLRMPAKIKDAALKGCEIVPLEWLLTSLACGYPIDTKDYRLETTALGKLGLKGSDKASFEPEADEEPKPKVKEAVKSKPKPKDPDERKLKLKGVNERNVLAKSQPKEGDEAKPNSKETDKTKPKSKRTGEAKRALEYLEDGVGTKKVAKTSSKVTHLKRIVDEDFPNLPKGLAVCAEGDVVWDATLMKALNQKTGKEYCQFNIFQIQLLWDPNSKKYDTFSHGKMGGVIYNASRSGLGNLEEAKAAFQELFHEATGLPWKSRLEDPKKEKFIYVAHHWKDEEASQSGLPIAKLLPPAVKAVLDAILSGKDQTELIKNFLKAIPAGPIKNGSTLVNQLRAGIALLKRVLERPDLANEINSDASPASIMLQCYHCSIGYGLSKAPLSLDWIQREQDHLSYLHIIVTASQRNRPRGWVEEQLSQHLHRVLGLNHMALVDCSTEEHRILADYFNFSDMTSAYGGAYGGYPNQLKNIFRIERLGEADRFLKWTTAEKGHGRCLLWHGSGIASFSGIFEKGLLGGIGHPRIYLSGLAGYSTPYCYRKTSMILNTSQLMLLCEVSSPEFSKAKTGRWWRDAGCVHADLQGVKMLNVPTGGKFDKTTGWPIQMEYSFQRAEQIRMRYLFEFEIGERK